MTLLCKINAMSCDVVFQPPPTPPPFTRGLNVHRKTLNQSLSMFPNRYWHIPERLRLQNLNVEAFVWNVTAYNQDLYQVFRIFATILHIMQCAKKMNSLELTLTAATELSMLLLCPKRLKTLVLLAEAWGRYTPPGWLPHIRADGMQDVLRQLCTL